MKRDKSERAGGRIVVLVILGLGLLVAGGWAAAKEKGWVRIEGKEYEVKDGDVMEFLFNV